MCHKNVCVGFCASHTTKPKALTAHANHNATFYCEYTPKKRVGATKIVDNARYFTLKPLWYRICSINARKTKNTTELCWLTYLEQERTVVSKQPLKMNKINICGTLNKFNIV